MINDFYKWIQKFCMFVWNRPGSVCKSAHCTLQFNICSLGWNLNYKCHGLGGKCGTPLKQTHQSQLNLMMTAQQTERFTSGNVQHVWMVPWPQIRRVKFSIRYKIKHKDFWCWSHRTNAVSAKILMSQLIYGHKKKMNLAISFIKKAEYGVITDQSHVCRGLYVYTVAAWCCYQLT